MIAREGVKEENVTETKCQNLKMVTSSIRKFDYFSNVLEAF